MAIAAYDRKRFLDELNEVVQTSDGFVSSADAKSKARTNLGVAASDVLSGITALTDSSGGTASDTIAAISATPTQAEIANAIASLAAKVNAILDALD